MYVFDEVVTFNRMRWAIVGVVVRLKEDQRMHSSRQIVFLVDHSMFGMRIVGYEALFEPIWHSSR